MANNDLRTLWLGPILARNNCVVDGECFYLRSTSVAKNFICIYEYISLCDVYFNEAFCYTCNLRSSGGYGLSKCIYISCYYLDIEKSYAINDHTWCPNDMETLPALLTLCVGSIYIYIYMCVCVYMCVYVYIYMHACMYVYMYLCMYVCMYICIYIYIHSSAICQCWKNGLIVPKMFTYWYW